MQLEHKYLKIRLHSIPPDTELPFDLYVAIGDRMVHYLRAGARLDGDKLVKLDLRGPQQFYILTLARQNYQKFIHDGLMSDRFDTKQKASILRESTMVLVEELFERADVERALLDARSAVEDFVSFMDSDPNAMANLIGLSSHDFYTYNHSLDVSIYALGLGQAVGFRGAELKELGLGGLFHDIGKRFISLDIITKSGPLTSTEWGEMKKHPAYGLRILEDYEVSPEIRACAFEHHESMSGNGYPLKLTGNEIHQMARVVSVADTYDALTTKRSYSQPMRPIDAISLMNGKLAERYDPEVLRALAMIFENLGKTA